MDIRKENEKYKQYQEALDQKAKEVAKLLEGIPYTMVDNLMDRVKQYLTISFDSAESEK